MTLKMKVKVTEYTDRNGSVRWKLSTSAKVLCEHFRWLSPFFRYLNFKFLENVDLGRDAVAPYHGIILDFLLDDNSIGCIFTADTCENKQLKNLTLKM